MRPVEIRPGFTVSDPALRSPTVPMWSAVIVGALVAAIAVSTLAIVLLGASR
jgi:hypothetical protein